MSNDWLHKERIIALHLVLLIRDRMLSQLEQFSLALVLLKHLLAEGVIG